MTLLLDGRAVAKDLQHQLQQQDLTDLTLGILMVGQHPASLSYIARKQKLAERLGIKVQLQQLDSSATTEEVIAWVDTWNNDAQISGILVQLPLPDQIDRTRVLDRICPYKDVDGLNPWSLGKLLSGQPMLVSATARGVVELLKYYDRPIAGQPTVVVGRSTLVGQPIALLLQSLGATVTVAHRQTTDLASVTKGAELLVVAAGHPGLITDQHVRPGAVVVDVGLTQTPDGLKGDINFSAVEPIASAISPVPGGVGPLTVTCLMQNVFQAHQLMQDSGHQHLNNPALN